jgi:CDGSH-type Zn-finger protein
MVRAKGKEGTMKRTGFTSKPKAMRQVSAKRTATRASAQGQADLAYMGQVRSLPCIICDTYGLTQLSATTAHHCIMDRGGNRKTPDSDCIPLCDGCHQGNFDTSKIAIHREPKAWRAEYGPDHGHIEATRRMVAYMTGGQQ